MTNDELKLEIKREAYKLSWDACWDARDTKDQTIRDQKMGYAKGIIDMQEHLLFLLSR